MTISKIAVLTPTESDLVDIGVLFAVVALVAFFALIYYYKIHNRQRRKRKRKHSRSHNPTTLAQSGGLPPVREPASKTNVPPADS